MSFNPHYDKQLARTEPGRGATLRDQGHTSVKSKGIPNAPTEHLVRARDDIHSRMHTAEGLSQHEDTRRSMIEFGIKGHMITHELHLRGEGLPNCQFCQKPGLYDQR